MNRPTTSTAIPARALKLEALANISASFVDRSELVKFELDVLRQFLAFPSKFRGLGVRLRADGHVLAGGRHGTGDETRPARIIETPG